MAGLKYSKDGQNWTTLKNYTIKNVDVFQETGDSTTGVMSQKAVTDALGEYVKDTEITEKVTEVVKTETVKESSELTKAIGDMVAKAIEDALKEGASSTDIKDAIDQAVADAIGDDDGEVKSAIEEAVSGKADKTELADLFDGAEYTTGTLTGTQGKQVIAFKHGTTVLAEVDATDFIKDGMVESVELTGGKLIITWNAASGKQQATEIEVSEIFNAENYYDKTEADAKFAEKATTLGGYGITDAKIEGNVITLGNETIEPITSLDGVLKGSVRVVNVTGNLTNQTTSVTAGQQETVIYANNGTEHTVAISTSSGYKTPDGKEIKLTIPANGYGEVNFLNVGGTIYARGV